MMTKMSLKVDEPSMCDMMEKWKMTKMSFSMCDMMEKWKMTKMSLKVDEPKIGRASCRERV